MTAPGVYPGLPMAEYLALPALSASVLRETVDRCPGAGWFTSWLNPARERDDTAASDAGSIAHEILLEGSEDCCTVIDPNLYPGKRGGIPDGWTNDAIREARDAARAAGKIPVLAGGMSEIRAMVASARRFIDSLRETEPAIWAAFQPDGGTSEVTVLWQEGASLARMRPDRLSRDAKLIIDPKFTARSAEPGAWGRSQLLGMGYHLSAAWYRRGIRAIFDVDCDYVFLVVETCPPYLCSLVGLLPAWLELGDSSVSTALRIWQNCERTGAWPAYPSRACYPELPGWAAAAWEDRQASDSFGIPYDVSKLFQKSTA